MKDIKKMLREQAPDILPDESVKENIRLQLGAPLPQEQAALAHGGTKALSSKKTWIALAALFLAAVLFVGLLLPALLKKTPASGVLNKFDSIETTEDFYLYGAASVGSLLSARKKTAALSTKSLAYASPAADLTDGEQQIVDTVNGYLSLVEGLLGDGSIEHSQITKPADPAYAQYSYYTVIRYKDLLEEEVSYELYYNELLAGVEQEDDETEENYDIEGILVVEGTAYEVYGSREASAEQDGNESESENELQFTAYLNAEKTQYLRMEQKTELETEAGSQESEQEFEYTFVSDGTWQERTQVKYEQEDGELELEITVEKRGQEKDELRFRRENGQTGLDVDAKIGGKDVRFTIEIVNENGNTFYRYRFGDDHSSDTDRYEGHRYHGNDDDDD